MNTPIERNSEIKTSLSVFNTSYPTGSNLLASNSNSKLDGESTVTSKFLALISLNALIIVESDSKFD